MASQINPNDIDGAYPVAGQDNNSQGFRDNFTNTKTNFGYAAGEITDLQNNVLLKSALTGTTLDNDMGGSLLYNYQSNQATQTLVVQTTTTGTVTLNYQSGSYQTLTPTGSVTLAFSNWPAASPAVAASITLQVTVTNTAYTLTLPASVSVGVANLQGYVASTRTITFSTTGTYTFNFSTVNGGTTITIVDLNRNQDPIYLPSSEDLASTAAANLSLTTSYFSTAAAETATLAAGYAGQVKVFAMYADSGDMVITVTNAGWKSSGTGTITFDTIGDACTLQYINSKWFCIGNNGCVFG
jgi:hypothetical protein